MGKSKERKKQKRLEREEEESAAAENKQLGTLDVKIKAIRENPDKNTLPPIIGYFSSGFDPQETESNTGASSSVKVYKDASRNHQKPRVEVVVGVDGSAVNFVGTNYSGEARAPQLCNYALGVFDKETRVLKMVPIASNKIFRLEPRVMGLEQPEVVAPDTTNDTKEEKAEKFRTTTLKFSTKRNIRRDEKREVLRQTGGTGAQEDMEDRLKAIKFNSEALEAVALTTNDRNIPPYDLAADAVEMAYPLEKIILKGEWNFLQDVFELVQGDTELPPDVYPSFVRNRVHKLLKAKDEASKWRIGGILSFITHLIKYKDRHSMDGVSSAIHHKVPNILLQRFSTMFAPTKDKRFPEEKLNLLISYILVLSLFIDDFLSDPSDIASDLRMNPIALRTHYEFLGCKFKWENQALVVFLPVPLEFQTIKRKRRARS